MDIKQNQKQFACEICQRLFSRKQFVRRHMATHSTSRPYQCNYCPKNYKYTKNLNRHLKRAHPQDFNTKKLRISSPLPFISNKAIEACFATVDYKIRNI